MRVGQEAVASSPWSSDSIRGPSRTHIIMNILQPARARHPTDNVIMARLRPPNQPTAYGITRK